MTNSWIWTDPTAIRNTFARFRRGLHHTGAGSIVLRISADSRYWVFLNGERLGFGPVRSWPDHWKYDEYDISAQLKPGENVLAVLVNHFGEGNFQYLSAAPGLWVELLRISGKHRPECLLRSDDSWRTDSAHALVSRVPRISVQQGFEEQFDARLDDGWTMPGYDDKSWSKAKVVTAPHPLPEPSGIPHLTAETVFPQRILRAEVVRPADYTWTLNVKPYFPPNDLSSNIAFVKGSASNTEELWRVLCSV